MAHFYKVQCAIIANDFRNFFKRAITASFFVYFRSFLVTISIQIEKSVDGMLGIQTLGHRMVGADETTELWRPPTIFVMLLYLNE